MKVTMKDVSKALQVPVSTLTARLNGYIPLRDETKAALEQFQKEYGE